LDIDFWDEERFYGFSVLVPNFGTGSRFAVIPFLSEQELVLLNLALEFPVRFV
jgi:hypothetical protein